MALSDFMRSVLPESDVPDSMIASVTETGTPVKNRVKSLRNVIGLYKKEKENHREDSIRRARLKGHINGNPPYSDAKLEELGLGYMTNVNFQEMRAILDTKASTHYELFFEVDQLIEVQQLIGIDTSLQKQQPGVDYELIIGEEWTTTMFDWTGFLPFMDKTRREADAFGLGLGGWRDSKDWRPKAFSCGSFLTNKFADMDIESMPYAFLRDRITIGELFRAALEDPEIGDKEGWNIPQVRKLMRKVFVGQANPSDKDQDTYQTSVWESYEQRIRNGDITDFDTKEHEYIDIAHFVVREVTDGKISRYIFEEGATELDDFLFSADREYDNMTQAIWWLPYNNGDGYLHSVRGMASMIEPHCDLSNRYLGRLFDAGFTSSSLLLQPNGPVDMSQLQLIRLGVITVLPHQLKVQQASFQPQVNQLIQLRGLSSELMKNNTPLYRPHSENYLENQPEKTARQVAEEATREARAEKSTIAYDYDHVDRLYREMFRRMTNKEYLESKTTYPGQKEAREFVVRCVKRGVPYDLLVTPGAFKIAATRAVGMGSWGTKMDITNQLINGQGVLQLDEAGRARAARDWLAVRVGYRNIDKYKPTVNRDKLASNETSIATLENNDMRAGEQVVVGSDQYHSIHFTVHAEPIAAIVQAFQDPNQQNQLDIKGTIIYFHIALAHMIAHIQYIQQDFTRLDFVKQAMDFVKNALTVMKQLESMQERADKAAAKTEEQKQALLNQAQQVLASQELQVKVHEIDQKYEVEKIKQESLNRMRADKTAAQMDIRRAEVAARTQLDSERQTAELEMERQKISADIAMKRLKSTS